jgi:hypothetical protein
MQKWMFIAIVLGACGKGGGSAATVDPAAYKAVQQALKNGGPWTEATAAVEQKLGPAKVKADDRWQWAASDGDTCVELTLIKDGDKLNGAIGGSANKIVESEFAKCAAIAGAAAK